MMQLSGEHSFTGDTWSQLYPHISPSAKKHKIGPGPPWARHPVETAGELHQPAPEKWCSLQHRLEAAPGG